LKGDLTKSMVSSAAAVLVHDNFYNLKKKNLLFINRGETKKLIGIVNRMQDPATTACMTLPA
jgi:hypothetical protein